MPHSATLGDLVGGLTLLRGWSITSGTDFILQSSLTLTGGSSYEVLIETGGDCIVNRVSLDVLVYVTLNATYQITLDVTSFDSTETSVSEFYRTVTDYDLSVFVLAIRGYEGLSVEHEVTFGWRVAATNSTNATIGFNLTNLLSMQYSFLQVSEVTITSNTTNSTTNTTTPTI